MEHVMVERWRPVVGAEGVYDVSDFGQVRSLPRRSVGNKPIKVSARILKQQTNRGGYLKVHLSSPINKNVAVHRLVAEAFLGPAPEGKTTVNHYDTDPKNNCAGNLEWADSVEQYRHIRRLGRGGSGISGRKNRLTPDTVRKEMYNLAQAGVSQAEIAARFHVHPSHVGRILKRAKADGIIQSYPTSAKLTLGDARMIRAAAARKVSARAMAKRLGVTPSAVRETIQGKRWKEPEGVTALVLKCGAYFIVSNEPIDF